MADGSFLTWAVRHGLVVQGLKKSAREGDPSARLLLDADVREDPYPLLRRLWEQGPVFQGQITWVAAQHASVAAILRSDNFVVGLNEDAMPWYLKRIIVRNPAQMVFDPISPPSMLASNGAQHMRYRRIVAKVFTPRAMNSLEDKIRAVANDLLDRYDGSSVVNIAEGFSSILPVTMISEILGIPEKDRGLFLKWGNLGAGAFDVGLSLAEYRTVETALRELSEWMLDHIRHLKKNPGDDLLSQMTQVEPDGAPMTDKELLYTAGLVLSAGFETTVNMLANGIVLLTRNPGEIEKLKADPSLWPNAVEEILRSESSIQAVARIAKEACEIEGVEIPAGAFVATLIGGANRDPKVFDDPDRFDVTRANARDHLSFSGGAHFCLGAHLARIEGRVALQTLIERFPDIKLAGRPKVRASRILRGYEYVPVHLGEDRRVIDLRDEVAAMAPDLQPERSVS